MKVLAKDSLQVKPHNILAKLCKGTWKSSHQNHSCLAEKYIMAEINGKRLLTLFGSKNSIWIVSWLGYDEGWCWWYLVVTRWILVVAFFFCSLVAFKASLLQIPTGHVPWRSGEGEQKCVYPKTNAQRPNFRGGHFVSFHNFFWGW